GGVLTPQGPRAKGAPLCRVRRAGVLGRRCRGQPRARPHRDRLGRIHARRTVPQGRARHAVGVSRHRDRPRRRAPLSALLLGAPPIDEGNRAAGRRPSALRSQVLMVSPWQAAAWPSDAPSNRPARALHLAATVLARAPSLKTSSTPAARSYSPASTASLTASRSASLRLKFVLRDPLSVVETQTNVVIPAPLGRDGLDGGGELLVGAGIDLAMLDLGARRVGPEVVVAVQISRGPDGACRKTSAAVRARVAQEVLDARPAKGAPKATDHGLRRIRR